MPFKDHFLTQLNSNIKNCENCNLKDNKGPVLGYGGHNADVMFVGDIAKESDTKAMVPFTGIAKDRMLAIISELGLKKGEYYFTYFIKHTIADDGRPGFTQTKPCLDILLKEIEIINPRIICSMGYYATKYLMEAYDMEDKNTSMTKLHGNGYIIPAKKSYKSRYTKKEDDRPKRYLIPTWSPAVDNFLMNKDMMEDILTIKSAQNISILLYP